MNLIIHESLTVLYSNEEFTNHSNTGKCIIMSNISGGFALICQLPILARAKLFCQVLLGSEAWESPMGAAVGREWAGRQWALGKDIKSI